MTELTSSLPSRTADIVQRLWANEKVWLVSASILILLMVLAPGLGLTSLGFVAQNLLSIAPFLALSVGIAAYAGATGADGLIARAFTGSPIVMILLAAVVGGLSPFCSCGVIPLIAALLAMGVPLSAVMAFWLASPVMDPSKFFLTTGVLGLEFAVAKTRAALSVGLFGGLVVHALSQAGGLSEPLREGVGNGGCGGAKIRTVQPVVWKFWSEAERTQKFGTELKANAFFLVKWLALTYVLEAALVTYVPANLIAALAAATTFPRGGEPRKVGVVGLAGGGGLAPCCQATTSCGSRLSSGSSRQRVARRAVRGAVGSSALLQMYSSTIEACCSNP